MDDAERLSKAAPGAKHTRKSSFPRKRESILIFVPAPWLKQSNNGFPLARE
jgi:hypothetical protein